MDSTLVEKILSRASNLIYLSIYLISLIYLEKLTDANGLSFPGYQQLVAQPLGCLNRSVLASSRLCKHLSRKPSLSHQVITHRIIRK